MKTQSVISAILLFSSLVIPSLSQASSSAELTNQVEQQVSSIQQALDESPGDLSCTLSPSGQASPSDAWIFRNIWIRLTTPVGFSIPGLASFTVVPTFEFLIQRTMPAGWQVYQPQ